MKSGRNLYFKRVEIEQWMKDNPAYVKNDYTQELSNVVVLSSVKNFKTEFERLLRF